MPITFHWKVAYLGEVDYEVYGDGPTYRVRRRYQACDYMRSITSAKGADFDKEYTNAIGLLRHDGSTRSSYRSIHGLVKPEVLDAFNAWRWAEHLKHEDYMRANWMKKYWHEGQPLEYPGAPPPAAVIAGYYRTGEGWIRGYPEDLEYESARQKSTCNDETHKTFMRMETMAEYVAYVVQLGRAFDASYFRGAKCA